VSGIPAVRSQVEDSFLLQPPEWLLDCSFVEENAAALALGSLESDEIVRINTHVSWCPNCARFVHESRKTTGYLPFLSPASSPSPSVRSKLFERIQQEQLQAPVVADSFGRSLTIPPSNQFLSAAAPSLSEVFSSSGGSSRKRRINWELIAAPLAAVPLVVALAIVGGWALRTQGQLDDRAAQTQVLQSENELLNARVDLLSNGLDTGSRQRFEFESVDESLGDNVGGNVVALTNGTYAKLSVWSLPTATRSYKVLIETEDGQLQQVGEFDVDQSGDAQVELLLSFPLDQYDSVHVRPVSSNDQSLPNDSLGDRDVLWMDLNTNLGSGGGTEANAIAN